MINLAVQGGQESQILQDRVPESRELHIHKEREREERERKKRERQKDRQRQREIETEKESSEDLCKLFMKSSTDY